MRCHSFSWFNEYPACSVFGKGAQLNSCFALPSTGVPEDGFSRVSGSGTSSFQRQRESHTTQVMTPPCPLRGEPSGNARSGAAGDSCRCDPECLFSVHWEHSSFRLCSKFLQLSFPFSSLSADSDPFSSGFKKKRRSLSKTNKH